MITYIIPNETGRNAMKFFANESDIIEIFSRKVLIIRQYGFIAMKKHSQIIHKKLSSMDFQVKTALNWQ